MVLNKRGSNWGSIYTLLQALVNRCFDDADLAVATNTTKIKTTDAVEFSIAGKLFEKAATDDVTVSGMTDSGAGQFSKIRVELNASGTFGFVQGPFAAAQVLAEVPRRSESKCTVGWIEIPASFVFGTSNFNDSGVTLVDGDPDLGDGSIPPHDRGMTKDIYHGK